MFGTDHWTFKGLGFQVSDLEDFFGLLHQRDVPGIPGLRRIRGNAAFYHLPQARKVDIESFEDANRSAFTFANDAEQEVLHANVVVPQPQGFFSAVSDDVLHAG